MDITIFKNFSKRTNSTKQPSASTGVVLSAYLKEMTSVENPSFIIGRTDDFESINYVYAINHYYKVDDTIILDNDRIELRCSHDLLATYKSNILSLNAYVERSASEYDDKIADGYVTIKNSEVVNDAVMSVGTLFNDVGVYILSVLNDVGSGAGFTTYYVIDIATMEYIATYCNQNLGTQSTSVLEWIQSVYLKTADAIVDCKWLPISVQALAGLTNLEGATIKIGKDSLTGHTGLRFKGTVIIDKEYAVTIPHIYDDFRKASPYTKTLMFLPFYSTFQFNTLDFEEDYINVKYNIDLATGDTTVYLYNINDDLVTTLNYNIASTSPVGKVGYNVANTITTTLASAGAIAGAMATGSAVALTVAGIGGVNASMQSALAISPSVKGSLTGRSMALNGLDIHVITMSNDTTEPNDLVATIGRPLNAYKTLSTLSGYVQTINASLNIAGRTTDASEINAMLDNGIYLE